MALANDSDELSKY